MDVDVENGGLVSDAERLNRDKRSLRKTMRSRRTAHIPSALIAQQACAHVARSKPFLEANRVGLYVGARGELDVTSLVATALDAGKQVALPRVLGPGAMAFLRYRQGAELVPNRFGILEPDAQSEPLPAQTLDLIVVPGLAFDRLGNRLGTGHGYYDRAMAHAPDSFLVGIAFAFQLVEQVPTGVHDLPMHAVATEDGVVHCPG